MDRICSQATGGSRKLRSRGRSGQNDYSLPHDQALDTKRLKHVEEWLDTLGVPNDDESPGIGMSAKELELIGAASGLERRASSRDADGLAPWLDEVMTPLSLLIHASRVGVNLGPVVTMLSRWPRVQIPPIPDGLLRGGIPPVLRVSWSMWLVGVEELRIAHSASTGQATLCAHLLAWGAEEGLSARQDVVDLLVSGAWAAFLDWPSDVDLPNGVSKDQANSLNIAAEVCRAGGWPMTLDVLETFEWWARSNSDFDEGMEALRALRPLGLVSKLEPIAHNWTPGSKTDWEASVVIAKSLHRSWPLNLALAYASETLIRPAVDILRSCMWCSLRWGMRQSPFCRVCRSQVTVWSHWV